MNRKILIYISCFCFAAFVFLIGWSSSHFFYINQNIIGNKYDGNILAPGDRLNVDEFKLYEKKILCINIENNTFSSLGDTNSMIPTLDVGHNIIKVPINNQNELQVGDIISFKYENIIILHRIVEINFDNNGWYVRTKGDNGPIDKPKVRFEQITGVVVGIFY